MAWAKTALGVFVALALGAGLLLVAPEPPRGGDPAAAQSLAAVAPEPSAPKPEISEPVVSASDGAEAEPASDARPPAADAAPSEEPAPETFAVALAGGADRSAAAPDDADAAAAPEEPSEEPSEASVETVAAAEPPSGPPAGPDAAAEVGAAAPAGDEGDAAAEVSETAATPRFDVVTYGEDGSVQLGGRGEALRPLRVFANALMIAETQVTTDGRWTARSRVSLAPGSYTLRVEALSEEGRVEFVVESPFRREAVSAGPGPGEIIVQPGDTLWRLAQNVYGAGPRYTVIYGANAGRIRDPDLIYPGQVLAIPDGAP